MIRRIDIFLAVAAFVAFSCTTVFAQRTPGNKPGQNTGNTNKVPRSGDRDEGTEYGVVVGLRAYGAQNSEKIGQINIRNNAGKQVSVHLTERTRYLMSGGDMDRDMVKMLLVKDVPVTLQWRYSAETGGKLAYSIEVRTISIQGTVTRANKRQLSVSALPLVNEYEAEPVAPPIRAGGRRVAEPPKRPEKKPPTPRTLTLGIKDHLTRVSLNGEKAAAADLKPKMTFDAVVIDGGPRWLIEINARGGDGKPAKDKDNDTGMSEDDDKPKDKKDKAGKKGKPKPPSE